ncbi:MAG: site-specific integrase [Clostridia bacterium]|nr:site-specific integrase [Clostridia bacterium]
MTFSQLAAIWYSNKECEGICYTYQLEIKNSIKHLNEFIGNRDITTIRPFDIDNIIVSRAKRNPNTGKPMSKKGLKDILNTANSIFEFAVDNDFIIKNPARNRKIPKNAKQEQRRALTCVEQQLIATTPHKCKTAALIMMLCGLRAGELLALQWSDVDLYNQVIQVHHRVQRTAPNEFTVTNGTKNGKCRKVPIPIDLSMYLQKVKNNCKSIYVCPKQDGNLHTPSSWKSAWKSYWLELNLAAFGGNRNKFDSKGVPIVLDNITPHMLRHTYATLLYKSGVDVLVASKLMGHSNVQITLDIYTHLDEENVDKNIQCLNDYLKDNFHHNFDL